MRRLLVVLAVVVVIVIAACAAGPQPGTVSSSGVQAVGIPLTTVTLATNGPHGSDTYRIPAMAVTADGTIVVTYDARRRTPADLPNDIDIVERRSTDGGLTWSTQTVAVAHAGGNTPATADGVGDSSLLYDRMTGRLFLFYELSPAKVGIFTSIPSISPASRTTVHPMVRYSDDNGLTWSAPIDLIQQLRRPDAAGFFASSGHGISTANGTLVQPYSYFVHHVEHAAVAYSSDHGVSWHLSRDIGNNLSENKVVQLADGTLLDDARPTSPGFRMFSETPCVNCAWSRPVAVTTLPDPMVNGDLIRVIQHPSWLLESNTASQKTRTKLTIRLSTDNGAHWQYQWVIIPGTSGYSVMAALPDGDYAIAYETDTALKFQRFSLNEVTNWMST